MKKVLITGASGFLGWSLCRLLKNSYQIEGLFYRQNFEMADINWHRINLLEEKELKKFIKTIKPDAILHAAAIANPNFCEEHPALSHHINVYATVAIAETCKELGIPLLFTSTDLVFSGSSGNYNEEDFAHPLSKYGEQKLAAEEILQDEFEQTLTCRLPLLFGTGPQYSNNFFSDWLSKMNRAEELNVFSDEYRSALSVEWAANGLKMALDYLLNETLPDKVKLLHLGGPERISRFDLAQLMAKVLKIEHAVIVPILRAEMPMPAPRPEDVSFDSSLSKTILGFNPPALENQLEAIIKH